jgi:hypothetical protein
MKKSFKKGMSLSNSNLEGSTIHPGDSGNDDSSNSPISTTPSAAVAVTSPKQHQQGLHDESFDPQNTSSIDPHSFVNASHRELLEDLEFDLYNMEIPNDPIPPNDIEDMVRVALLGKISEKNRLVANLTEFAFTYTIENLPPHQSRAPLDQIWLDAGLKFDEIYAALPLDDHWRERLFRYFPNSTWPKEFSDYISELKSKKPSQLWLNKSPRVIERTAEEQQITYFGNLLRDRYLTARNFIKWHLIKKWKEPEELPIGWTIPKLLYAIRKSLWPAECRRRYIETVSRKARRQKLGEDETRSLIEKPRETKRWDPNWYPSTWLTFLLLGKPSDHIGYMFQHPSSLSYGSSSHSSSASSSANNMSYDGGYSAGHSSYQQDDDSEDDLVMPSVSSLNQASVPAKRDSSSSSSNRKRSISQTMGHPSTLPTTPGGGIPLTVEEEQKRIDCQTSINALERKLAILAKQGRPDHELREVENELLECLDIQASVYKKHRSNA